MHVRDLLKKKAGAEVITIAPDTPLGEAVDLLIRHTIGGLPVVAAGGALRGFVAERDLLEALHEADGDVRRLPVDRFMRSPAPTCGLDAPLQEVMGRMTRKRLRHLVVLEDDRIAGVVSVGDIVKHRLEQLETETAVLRDYVAGQRARG